MIRRFFRVPVLVGFLCLLALVAVGVGLVLVPRPGPVSTAAMGGTGPAPVSVVPTSAAPPVVDSATPVPLYPSSGSYVVPPSGDVLAVLAALPVKGKAPKTGYDRREFQNGGVPWGDPDRNRCDTRNDILRRDLEPDRPVPGQVCLVAAGTLHDPYTGRTIEFVRGPDSSAVQIDHVVALSNAWVTGAQQLDKPTRIRLANDPLNLRAVDGPTNGAKGDKDASGWLPPNKASRCEYVARQVAVKARYQLWVTVAERDAITRVLADCPGQGLPDGFTK